jgi:hypothetical protein
MSISDLTADVDYLHIKRIHLVCFICIVIEDVLSRVHKFSFPLG